MKANITLMVALFSGSFQPAHAATINGTVILKGTPPAEIQVDLTEYPELAAKYPQGLTTRFYEVNPEGGLQNALIYLSDIGTINEWPSPEHSITMEHINGLFQPYVVGIQTGQPLQLTCKDGTLCSFFVRTRVNRPFVSAPLGRVVVHTFSKPETEWVRIICDMHPWNFAYLAVFEHPYFAVTDEQGKFVIRNVPPGQFTIAAVHRRAHPDFKGIIQRITVNNEDITLDYVIEVQE
jgi:hypothetical protein